MYMNDPYICIVNAFLTPETPQITCQPRLVVTMTPLLTNIPPLMRRSKLSRMVARLGQITSYQTTDQELVGRDDRCKSSW